jgi:hypothetical protein
MTKGSVFDFTGLYSALLTDIALYLPTDQREWKRDLSRIQTLYQTRGPLFSTMDLPALGKRLDAALSSGRLDLKGLPLSRGSHFGSLIPRLFRGLWMRLFDSNGCLLDDIDPNVVLFLRTLLYVGKNFKSDCSPRYLFEATKEFFDVETQIPPASPLWDGDGSDFLASHTRHLGDMVASKSNSPLFGEDGQSALLGVVQHVADVATRVFSGFDPDKLECRHGPGAVSDLRSGRYKYNFPNWAPRLETYHPYDLRASTSLEVGGVDPHVGFSWDSYEPQSNLIAVPKTMKGPRLIASEPTCHQWIQQGIRNYVYREVHRSWLGNMITFNDQEPSRTLALQSSLDGTMATIDLKSASDRLSCALVERIFRSSPLLLASMAACRTRFLSNKIDKAMPALIKLRKFSTQGSALTFPIQSVVFAILCLGVGKYLHPKESLLNLSRRVRVFGDDLIVPGSWEPMVEELLHTLHLRVNQTKTHKEGNFRESCGMDAFAGYDVTPPYVLASPVETDPASVASSVAVSNNLFKKGFWRTAEWLEKLMPRRMSERLPTVSMRSGVFARQSFVGNQLPKNTKFRWNEALHKREYLCLGIFAKAKVERTDTASNLLQYFTEAPAPYIQYESGVVVAGVPKLRHTWADLASISE